MTTQQREKSGDPLSRRERQIMDAIYRRGEATAAEVRDALPDAPSYSAIRALLRILEDKGHLRHREDGPRYVYAPIENAHSAARNALQKAVRTFFSGSVGAAVAALLTEKEASLTDEEYARLSELIEQARERARDTDHKDAEL